MGRTLRTCIFAAALVAAWGGAALTPAPAWAKDKPGEQSGHEQEFAAGWASDDAAKRAAAIDVLRAAPDALKLRLISTAVIPREKRADLLGRAVEVLGRIKDEPVCEALVALTKSGPSQHRVLYVEALGALRNSPSAHRAALDLARDKDAWIRAMAIWALGEHRTADALDTLLAALGDRQWQVQSAAVAAFPFISDKEALRAKVVPKLVDYLEGSAGRLREDCAYSLRKITGKNLGRDVALWRKWIAEGDAAIAPKEPAAGGDAETPYGNQATKPHFYGMEVASTRFVIVFDRSLSMLDAIEIDKERLRRETSQRKAAVTGANAPKPGEDVNPDDVGYDIPWWRVKTRLDLARYQAINLIAGLEPDQSFEMILFSTEVEPWMNRLVPATQANKQKAIAMLETIKADGETNTWGALAAAFEMSAANSRTGAAGQPDEIYFVTDGAPSKGDIQDGNQIYEAVVQLAKVQQMRVNVIGIGVNLTFLRKMAVSTGGQCKFFL